MKRCHFAHRRWREAADARGSQEIAVAFQEVRPLGVDRGVPVFDAPAGVRDRLVAWWAGQFGAESAASLQAQIRPAEGGQ